MILEQQLIPTDQQRQVLFTAILDRHTTPGVYALCDLLGWLDDQGRTADQDAVLEALDEPAWWNHACQLSLASG